MAFRCYKTASSDLSKLAPLFQAFVQGFLVVLLVSCGPSQLVQIFWGMNRFSGGEQYNYLMCLYEQKGEQSNYFTCLYKLAFHTSYCICLFFVAMMCWLTFSLYSPIALVTLPAETLLSFLLWSVCADFYLPMTYSSAHHLSALSPACLERVKFPSRPPKHWVLCADFKT